MRWRQIGRNQPVAMRPQLRLESARSGQRETTVTFGFEPIADGMRATVRHEGFAGLRQPADQYAEGWERVLGWVQ